MSGCCYKRSLIKLKFKKFESLKMSKCSHCGSLNKDGSCPHGHDVQGSKCSHCGSLNKDGACPNGHDKQGSTCSHCRSLKNQGSCPYKKCVVNVV